MKLKISDLSFAYKNSQPIFSNIELSINTNDITLLLGANGSGKTTLCRIISNLDNRYSGEILLDDISFEKLTLADLSAKLVYLKQEPVANVVAANADEDLSIWQTGFLANDSEELKVARQKAMQEFSIADISRKPTWELSNGQLKRIGLASLMLNYHKFWILDEPFSGLNKELISNFLKVLKKRKKENKGALIITHRDELLRKLINRTLVIKNKRIIEV